MKRYLLIFAGIVALAVGGWFVLFRGGEQVADAPPGKPQPLVRIDTVRTGSISNRLDITGSVEPTRVARLASPVEGPVVALAKREGDRVRGGEIVARIGRDRAATALVTSAREDLRREEEEVRRVERLAARGAIPGEQLERAQAQRERTRAQLARAEEGLDDYVVRAPWAGIISRVSVAEGNFVAPRGVLIEMYDPASLRIRCEIPEAHAAGFRPGIEATARLDAHPERSLGAKVSRVYAELDRATRTLSVEATLTERVALLPGMFARLSFALETVRGVVVMPAEAVVVTPKGERVAFVLEDGKAVRRAVSTGLEERGRVQVTSGIIAGERVIVAGNENLKDGAEVRVQGVGRPGAPGMQTRRAPGVAGRSGS